MTWVPIGKVVDDVLRGIRGGNRFASAGPCSAFVVDNGARQRRYQASGWRDAVEQHLAKWEEQWAQPGATIGLQVVSLQGEASTHVVCSFDGDSWQVEAV